MSTQVLFSLRLRLVSLQTYIHVFLALFCFGLCSRPLVQLLRYQRAYRPSSTSSHQPTQTRLLLLTPQCLSCKLDYEPAFFRRSHLPFRLTVCDPLGRPTFRSNSFVQYLLPRPRSWNAHQKSRLVLSQGPDLRSRL